MSPLYKATACLLSLDLARRSSSFLSPSKFCCAFCSQAEIKLFLEKAHNLEVESVRTLNVEGKKKRSKTGFYRRADFKKVYVTLKEPAGGVQQLS